MEPHMNDQIEAWNELYGNQKRQWRGMSDIEFPFTKGSSVIEIGCGNGKTSAALLEKGFEVTGIDFSENAINHCAETFPEMRSVCASSTALPFADREFDGAVLVHILEHLDDDELKATVEEVRRVLKENGKVLVRAFTEDDMRHGNGIRINGFDVRNGIRYRYFSEKDIKKLFSDFDPASVRTMTQSTKFGEIRSRIEGVFEKK